MATPQELQAELARRQTGVSQDQIQVELLRRQQPVQQNPLLRLQDLLVQQARGEQGLQPEITQLREQTGRPDSGELAVQPAGILETITGAERIALRPELGTLPEFGASERADQLNSEGFKLAAGLLSTANPDEQIDVIKGIIPEAEFEKLNDGTIIVNVPDGQGGTERSVLNRPGFSPQDFTTGVAQALAFVPAAKIASFGKTVLQKAGLGAVASGTTEALRQEAVIALGSEQGRRPEEVALAAGLGAGAEVVSPFFSRLRSFLKASPDPEAAVILQAGERAGVPVLTSDVLPPQTFFAKGLQSLGDKIGILGTGRQRALQQKAREDVVQSIADDFGIENVNDDFLPSIIDSLTSKQAKGLADASTLRNEVIDKLVPLGNVQVNNTIRAIDKAIAAQTKLRAKGNQALIDDLNDIKSSIEGDFNQVKNIRSDLTSDIRAVRRGEDQRTLPALQSVKSAIDKDMVIFARRSQKELNDKTIVRDWLSSNRAFAFELGKSKDAVLKRLIEKGDVTPKNVSPVLRGGDPTEMLKLKNSLTPKGVKNAQSAIIKDALETSKFFTSANPDLLANTLNKPKFKRAVNVFFNTEDKRQLEGLSRLLDSTRRAQTAAVATKTGQEAIPIGVLAVATQEPLTAVLTASTLAAVTRGYESKAVRNILLKLAASKKGSAAEANILRDLQPIIQSARLSQQNTEGQ